MSWEDALRRMLTPLGSFEPHTTSAYDAIRKRGTSPHRGVDANYNVGPNGQQRINLMHPALRSPVDGIVTRAGEGTAGTIAIRDANGLSHELLHTHSRYVRVGDPVTVGQIVGTMGNTGVIDPYLESGDHHLHYQLKSPGGDRLNPQAFWDQQGPIDLNPPPPAYVPEYQQYVRSAAAVPESSRDDVRILRRIPDGDRPPFNSKQVPPPYSGSQSPLPPIIQGYFTDRLGHWPLSPESDISTDPSQFPQGQSGTPDDEDWYTRWRRRTGQP